MDKPPFFPRTLSFYLMRVFGLNLVGMMFILTGVIWFFDLVELMRRGAKAGGVPFGVLVEMATLKVPNMTETLFPFITLFAALFTFWQLARRSELVVFRAAGVSAWQFLRPVFLTGGLAGLVIVLLFNPLSALFFQKYNSLQAKYLSNKREIHTVAIFDDGLWLRQSTDRGYAILHADKIALPSWRLENVFTLFFNDQNEFVRRIDAPRASLSKTAWQFSNVTIHNTDSNKSARKSFELPTNLTREEIENSFASPETMGFWSLPNFISTLDHTGFDSTKLRIHFHGLIALPFLCCAMILLASLVALRPQRSGDTFLYIVGGVLIGFALFFLSSFLQALGASHQVPVFLAAWTPALLSILIGSTILLIQEDG